jgi:hypothetical protein
MNGSHAAPASPLSRQCSALPERVLNKSSEKARPSDAFGDILRMLQGQTSLKWAEASAASEERKTQGRHFAESTFKRSEVIVGLSAPTICLPSVAPSSKSRIIPGLFQTKSRHALLLMLRMLRPNSRLVLHFDVNRFARSFLFDPKNDSHARSGCGNESRAGFEQVASHRISLRSALSPMIAGARLCAVNGVHSVS